MFTILVSHHHLSAVPVQNNNTAKTNFQKKLLFTNIETITSKRLICTIIARTKKYYSYWVLKFYYNIWRLKHMFHGLYTESGLPIRHVLLESLIITRLPMTILFY